MTLTNLEKWEAKLKIIFDELDDILEDNFGNMYRLHPARSNRGTTSNKSQDGLFDVTANFSLGLGSDYGRGYILKIKMVTLQTIPPEVLTKINNIAMKKISKELPKLFPDRDLKIKKDRNLIKIFGDLNLDRI